jgi:hypothetical protein
MGLPASLLLAKSAGNIGAAGILTDGHPDPNSNPAADHSGGTAADFHGLPPTLPRLRNCQTGVYARLPRLSNCITPLRRFKSSKINLYLNFISNQENFSAVLPHRFAFLLHGAQTFLRIFQPIQLIQEYLH